MFSTRVAISTLILCFLPVAMGCYHITPHQHVTVYERWGRLLRGRSTGPGFNWINPFTTTAHNLFVEEQVDLVSATCGTKDGIELQFKDIEITNQLPRHHVEDVYQRYGLHYDQIPVYKNVAFYLQTICANRTAEQIYIEQFADLDDMLLALLREAQQEQKDPETGAITFNATGLIIHKVKVYKPRATNSPILESFRERAEAAAREQAAKANEGHILQANKNELKKQEGELDRLKQENAAQLAREKANNQAMIERDIAGKEADEAKQRVSLRMKEAAAQTEANVTTTRANAVAAAREREAAANERYLSDAYVRLESFRALANNTKFYWGDSLPKWLNTNDLMGGSAGGRAEKMPDL